jgi:hypothetical protein
MWDVVVQKLVENSILGVVLIPLGYFTYKMYADLRSIEGKRVTEAQSVVTQLLNLNNAWNTTINSFLVANETQKEIHKDIKEIIKDLRDTMVDCKKR